MKKHTNRQRALRAVGTPSNPTAFLRDGARYGAMSVTKNGVTQYFVGAPTHYYDIDSNTYRAPLFAPTSFVTRHAVKSVSVARAFGTSGLSEE